MVLLPSRQKIIYSPIRLVPRLPQLPHIPISLNTKGVIVGFTDSKAVLLPADLSFSFRNATDFQDISERRAVRR